MTQANVREKGILGGLALLVATLSIVIAGIGLLNRPSLPSIQTEGALARVRRQGVLRVAYGGFPPYTIIDLNETDENKRMRGFAVDMIEEIAKRHEPPLKLEWHQLHWETMRADMLSGKFDLLVDAVYQTVQRASDFGLSEPFSYFGVACGLVRKDDNRFKTFQDLDRDDVTIAVAVGWTSTEFAKRHLKKPKWIDVVVGESPFVQFDEVLNGRADVALQDVPTLVQYAHAHKNKVKVLWLDKPPTMVAGGFATRLEDRDLLDFINAGIRILKVDGTIRRIDEKWKGLGYYEKVDLVPGTGLTED